MKWWTYCLVVTDIRNPLDPSTPLYADAKIRPAWYWCYRRVGLFLSILWRKYEAARIDWRTAWSVSECAVGLTRKDVR